jgi:hypothetical protein
MSTTPNIVGNKRIAALVGNGLSIAFNKDLMLSSINKEILNRLNTATGSAVNPVAYIQEAAAHLGTGDPTSDFEAICGPLEQLCVALGVLQKYVDCDPDRLKKVAFGITAKEIDRLHRQGVGHVLEVIAERSVASFDAGDEVIDFLGALADAADGWKLTIGNLNYDSLALAAIARNWSSVSCDMTKGYAQPEDIEVVPGHILQGRPLRTSPDFPMSRWIRLIHLHGSLAWLREPGTGRVMRFDMDDLRNCGYWEAWRDGRTQWRPEVVLTNQRAKSAAVRRAPFSLAYQSFYEELVRADRWVIAGYSFRDECLNNVLAKAWADRRGNPPQVLMVTKGADPSLMTVLDALGYDRSAGDPRPLTWLHIHRDGIASAPASVAWSNWAASIGLAKAS